MLHMGVSSLFFAALPQNTATTSRRRWFIRHNTQYQVPILNFWAEPPAHNIDYRTRGEFAPRRRADTLTVSGLAMERGEEVLNRIVDDVKVGVEGRVVYVEVYDPAVVGAGADREVIVCAVVGNRHDVVGE
jgi:hypothetical protein